VDLRQQIQFSLRKEHPCYRIWRCG